MSRADDDDPWTTESDDSWYPTHVDAPSIDVDWSPPEPAGFLWMLDGTYYEVSQDRPPFGFGRWLHEQQGDMQMGLIEEARAETRHGGGQCSIAAALDTMKPKVRAEWVELFASDATHAAIARVSVNHGYHLKKSSVQRHRNGDCKCP